MNLTQEEIKLLEKNKIIPEGCPLAQVEFFSKVCEKKKLDPFTRQIHLVERNERVGDGWRKSYTIQAGIDGMRAIAQRNAKIKSYKRWVEKREDDLYGICEIDTEDRGIYRDELPFNEYKQIKKDGSLNSFWAKFPQTMIKKCAEESVLRMMTPEDLSGVYGDDEMMQADEEPKQLPEKSTKSDRDFSEEVKDFIEMKQVKDWWNGLNSDEQKQARNIKESVQSRIIKENPEEFIGKLKSNTWDGWQFTLEKIIDDELDLDKKEHLIKLLEERLAKVGVEYKYEELIFDKIEKEKNNG